MSRRHSSHESGFTIVEVLVAALILVIVSSAFAAAFARTTTSTRQSKTRDRQHQIAQGLLKRTIADTSWIERYSCGVGVCAGAGTMIPDTDPQLAEPDGTIKHSVHVSATGIDSDDDGTGDGDKDGIVPDEFRIVMEVTTATVGSPTAPEVYRVTGNLNQAARTSGGTIHLQVCSITPQADERIHTDGCRAGAPQRYDIKPPTSCPVGNLDCSAWAAAPSAARTVNVQRVPGAAYTLTGPLTESSPTSRSVVVDGSGEIMVRDLPGGQYRLEPASSSATGALAPWRSHSLPTSEYLVVKKGELTRSVQFLRPKIDRQIRVNVRTIDKTDPFDYVMLPYAKRRMIVKLAPAPTGRAPLARGDDLGWTVINPGESEPPAYLKNPQAGLYAESMLRYPGDRKQQVYNGDDPARFVWIDPNPAYDSPTSIMLQEEYCNVEERHVIVVRECGDLRWCFPDGVPVRECEDDPVPVSAGAIGGGGV